MKITGYNPTITTGGAVNAQVGASTDVNAYGGKGNGYKAVSTALGKVQQAYEKVSEEEDKRKLMSAMDTYNKGRYDILYNDENGVMNTKLEGAAGSVDSYIERENKLRKEIMGNLKFRTDKYKLAFQDMINKSAEQGFQLVDRHQYKELEAQQDVTLNNNLDNAIMMAQKNYGNDDSVMQSVAEGRLMISARYADRGQEFVEKMNNQFEGKIGEMLIGQAVMRGEYDRADEIKTAFDGAFTSEQRNRIENLIFKKQQDEFEMKLAESLVARYGEDIGGVVAELEGTNAFGSERPMTLKERQSIVYMVQGINNTNKAIEKIYNDKVYDESLDAIGEMIDQGKTYVDAMNWAKEQAGTNVKQLKALQSAVNVLYERGQGAGFKGLPKGEVDLIDVMLRNGSFKNEMDYLEYVKNKGGDLKDIVSARENYKNFAMGTGKYAYKWNEIKKMVMGKTNLTGAEEAMYKGATIMAGMDIAKFITEKKRQPSEAEVIDMANNNMGKAYIGRYNLGITGWDRLEASNAELALVGIKSVVPIGENMYRIEYFDGRIEAGGADTLTTKLRTAMEVTSNG